MLIVLSILIIASLLVASSVAVSQLISIETANSIDSERCYYLAESAANYARWMSVYDNNHTKDRNIPESDTSLIDTPRWQADGKIHNIQFEEDQTADIQLFDFTGMVNLTNGTSSRVYRLLNNYYDLNDSNKKDQLNALFDAASDYADSDDDIRTNGYEADDYLNNNRENLPRNAFFRYRDEYNWLPGLRDIFPLESHNGIDHIFQPILQNNNSKRLAYRPLHFFNVSEEILKAGLPNLSEEEVTEIIAARKVYQKEKDVYISDLIDSLTLQAIKQQFSFIESGYYYTVIKVKEGEGRPIKTIVVSFLNSEADKRKFIDWQFY